MAGVNPRQFDAAAKRSGAVRDSRDMRGQIPDDIRLDPVLVRECA